MFQQTKLKMSDIVQETHDLIKSKGFPYYPKDEKWRNNVYNQLMSFRRDTMIDHKNKVIGQSTHGLNLAWSYMEHAWDIRCGKMKTPMEIWDDEEHLKKGINKILTGTFFKQKKPHDITDSDMRSMLRRYSGTQMVSNFRPTAAAALYDIFVEKDSPLEGTSAGTVWDPSMGYGGRLLGAIAAGVNYIGTDPCIPTYDGLQGILNDFGNPHNTYQLHRQGSETFIPEDESLDFVFIDADHSYNGVMRDVEAWAPKVRKGGMIIGHDIHFPTVKQAVEELYGEGNYIVEDDFLWLVEKQ